MYSDVLLVKTLSPPEVETGLLGQYGFCLTVANMVLLLPTSIVQVDLEKMKQKGFQIGPVVFKSHKLLLLSTIFVGVAYLSLVNFVFQDYKETSIVFFIILIGKYFQGASMPLGTLNLIAKKYGRNLYINIIVLVLNVVISALVYSDYGLIGIATTSATLLVIRYVYFHIFEFQTKPGII
jgi:O-antigen/teichoic acid export membrane protein